MREIVLQVGIIPAYAGSTIDLHRQARRIRDHPRVCGEHLFENGGMPLIFGSSPRMR